MKIILISPYPDITSFGIRTISAYLKQGGHQTKMIFLPDPYGDNIAYGIKRYDERILDCLIPLCEDSDIIGITLMTNFFDGAVQITEKIKRKLVKPVIWGGIHPTVRPEECLKYADIVCIGEGEDAIQELLDNMQTGKPYDDTQNIWFKKDGVIIKNPVRELNRNLDVYPLPDYSLDNHYLMFENRIELMNQELLKLSLPQSPISKYLFTIPYQTMTSRGCPHKCTYCANDTFKKTYGEHKYLRWRSIDHILKELLWVKQRMPYVGHMWFSDDSFFARSREDIKDFCDKYKKNINLPFYALASPTTLSDDKLSLLVNAGLICVHMGIQTGSSAMQALYNRQHMSNEIIFKAIKIINKYKNRTLPPNYDFLLDCPYETTRDKIDSLRFISKISKPFRLQIFSIVLYPGTQLYEMVKRDGLVKDDKKEIYNKSFTMRKTDYLNLLFAIAKTGILPGWLLRVLISNPAVYIFNSSILKPFIKYLDGIAKRLKLVYQKYFGQ